MEHHPSVLVSAAFRHAFFMGCGSSLEAADRAVADVEGSGDMDQFCSPKLAPCEVFQYLFTQRIRAAEVQRVIENAPRWPDVKYVKPYSRRRFERLAICYSGLTWPEPEAGSPARSPATKKGRCRLHGGARGSGVPPGAPTSGQRPRRRRQRPLALFFAARMYVSRARST